MLMYIMIALFNALFKYPLNRSFQIDVILNLSNSNEIVLFYISAGAWRGHIVVLTLFFYAEYFCSIVRLSVV